MESARPTQSVPQWLLCGLFALAVLPFAVTWWGEFVYDDLRIVVHDARVIYPDLWHQLWTREYWNSDRGTNLSNWRPLTSSTYALNRFLLGPQPWSFHLINTLIHGATTLVLCRLALSLIGPHGAVVSAAVFAVHPLHTEAVANVVGRAELLSALFALLAWQAHRSARPGRAALWFALGVLAKETALPILGVMVLDDALGRPGAPERPQWTLRAWLPIAAVTLAYFAARWAVIGSIGGNRGLQILWVMNPLLGEDVTLPARIATALRMLALQWWLFLWPARLCADYSWRHVIPSGGFTDPAVLASVLLLAIGAAAAVRLRRQRPAVTLALGSWLILASLTSNLVILVGVIFAERLVYLPSTGMCLLAGTLLTELLLSPRPAIRRAAAAGFALALTAMAARTVVRSLNWHDARTLWEHDVQVAPLSSQIWTCLGVERSHAGDVEGALRALRRGVELSRPSDDPHARPRSIGGLDGLVRVLAPEADAAARAGDAARAEELRRECDWAIGECLRLNPTNSEILSYHAIRLFQRGEIDDARRVFQLSVQGREPDPVALSNCADFQRRTGDLAGARATLERAIAIHRDAPMFHRKLAEVLEALQQHAQAAAHLAEAERLERSGSSD